MKADITRDTFDPRKRYTRVLMQQGRVQLDADMNEQASILLQFMRSLAADIIGPHGGPGDAFLIGAQPDGSNTVPHDFSIHSGRYYIGGLLVENDSTLDFAKQPWAVNLKPQSGAIEYLVYLDAWERLVSFIEDDSIREVALGGPDTAARTQVVWKARPL